MSKALLSFDGAAFNQRNKDMLRYACILKFNDLFLDGIIVFIVVAAVFEKLFFQLFARTIWLCTLLSCLLSSAKM